MDYLYTSHENDQESADDPQYHQTTTELPFYPEAKYTICKGRNASEIIQEHLEQENFYEPISINECFPENQQLWYTFCNHLKKNEIFIKGTVLFAQHCVGTKGNIYFVRKEDKTSEHHATITNKTINDIVIKLPKCVLHGHKK